MPDIVYVLPYPDGTVESCDVTAVEDYVSNANNYLNTQGLDTRLAVYQKCCAVVFPLSSADYATYLTATDSEKKDMYDAWVASMTSYPDCA